MTDSTNGLTAEQNQRLVACDNAAKFLRNGGASLANNSTQAAAVNDIVDLAHYITTGTPFSIAHAHECGPVGVDLIVGKPGDSLADVLTGIFREREGEKSKGDENVPDFDLD